MADIDLKYSSKLERFRHKSCMTVYYSAPIAEGVFNVLVQDATIIDTKYVYLKVTMSEFDGYLRDTSIFSCGFFAGKVHAVLGMDIWIKVNKDSFVTATALQDFISKHSGTHYRFELLREYNGSDVYNSVLYNVGVGTKRRINYNETYSPWGFSYSKDYMYEIKTKKIILTDNTQIDDILRADSVVIRSTDDSVIREGILDDLPDIIGINGETANIVPQPYFGGTQNNEWYRAKIKDKDFVWENNRMKVILTLEIRS